MYIRSTCALHALICSAFVRYILLGYIHTSTYTSCFQPLICEGNGSQKFSGYPSLLRVVVFLSPTADGRQPKSVDNSTHCSLLHHVLPSPGRKRAAVQRDHGGQGQDGGVHGRAQGPEGEAWRRTDLAASARVGGKFHFLLIAGCLQATAVVPCVSSYQSYHLTLPFPSLPFRARATNGP